VTWGQVAPKLADCWSDVERPDQLAVRNGILDAIARLQTEPPADYLASLRTQPPPAAPRPDPLGDGLQLAAATANDGEQRALDHSADNLEELQQLRKELRDELDASDAGSPLLHVRPWVWTHASGGIPRTDAGAATGAELRFSRYRDELY
jgi:hypothetical protein